MPSPGETLVCVFKDTFSSVSFLFLGIWSSLPLGEQLYWSQELQIFLPFPPFPDSPHYGCVWFWPPLCPLSHRGTLRGPHCCHVSLEAFGLWDGVGRASCVLESIHLKGKWSQQNWEKQDNIALFSLTTWNQNGSDVCGWLVFHPCSWPHRISCGAGG